MAASPTIRRGNGPGHGGPAKGAGSGPAVPFTADSPTRSPTAHLENDDPEEQAYRAARRAEKRERKERDDVRADMLKDHLFGLARSAASERAQISAAEAWLNRHEGMPVARTINLNVSDMTALSDADLDAEISRLAGAEGSAGAGVAGEAPQDVSE